jgi:site-specific DNA-methyltransferase (adenine-specific)
MHQGKYGGDMSLNETRIHPTQKPVALYEWLFDNYAQAGQAVLDTHLGSGSSAVAANNRGLKFVGIEKDAAMFDAACRRIEDAQAQGQMFVAPVEKPVQGGLFAP